MSMAGVALVLAALLNATVVPVDPVAPPNAVSGGAVIAALHISGGEVGRIDILEGQEPFIESAAAALSQWQFSDGRDGTALVVVHFREPNLLSMGETAERVPSDSAIPELPYPKAVTQPLYPPNAIDSAAVTLRVEVGASGTVTGADVVRGEGAFVEASLDALKAWRFSPAHGLDRNPVSSEVFVVFVFRAPVLAPGGTPR